MMTKEAARYTAQELRACCARLNKLVDELADAGYHVTWTAGPPTGPDAPKMYRGFSVRSIMRTEVTQL